MSASTSDSAGSSAAPPAVPTPASPVAGQGRLGALVSAERARRWGSWYIAEHRLRGMRSYGWTIVATSLGTPFVYLFALGVGLASLVDAQAGPEAVQGVSFLAFVAPALLATNALMIAAEELSFPMYAGFKWNPIFSGMNAAPIQGGQIVTGSFLAVIIRMLVSGSIYFLIMLAFGAVLSPWAVLAVPGSALAAMAIGAFHASISASLDPDEGQLTMIQRFGITPLMLFSGTFFPLTELPIWLQPIGWVSPLWHGAELGRTLSYGDLADPAVLGMLAVHVIYPLVLVVVGWRLCQRVVTRRLNK